MAVNKCIGCDTPIPPGDIKCPMCGASVDKMKRDIAALPDTLSIKAETIKNKSTTPIQPHIETKKCKYCAMSVPKSAKICPYCRKKLSIGLIGKVVAGLAILFLFSYMSQLSSVPSAPTIKTEESKPIIVLTGKAKILKDKYPHWSQEDCKAIAEGKIYLGMPSDQALESLGKPYKINTSVGSYGRHEQWVMRESGNTYFYFQNGILTSWQQ